MIAILFFVVFVIVGDALSATVVAALVEPLSKSASLLVFLAMFIGVFWIAWMLAVKVTERYFVKPQ